MLKVGMTGGIASGKTQAANLFAKFGCDIIDTDVIARELVDIDMPAWKAIVARFGQTILQSDNNLDRTQLKLIVFNNSLEKKWLEKLLHPMIRAAVSEAIAHRVKSLYCIIVIPLLVETLPNANIDRILVIDVDEKIQLQRLLQRDNLSVSMAKSIIYSQISRQKRLTAADDIIENNASLFELEYAVQKMHSFYLSLAQKAT